MLPRIVEAARHSLGERSRAAGLLAFRRMLQPARVLCTNAAVMCLSKHEAQTIRA